MFVSRNSAYAECLANVAAQYSLEPTLFDSGHTTFPTFFFGPSSSLFSSRFAPLSCIKRWCASSWANLEAHCEFEHFPHICSVICFQSCCPSSNPVLTCFHRYLNLSGFNPSALVWDTSSEACSIGPQLKRTFRKRYANFNVSAHKTYAHLSFYLC